MILWIIAAICAFFIKGLCGFANTLVFTSILSFGVNNASISPVELLLGYPGNLLLAWKERKKINWKICGSTICTCHAWQHTGCLLFEKCRYDSN